MNFNAAKRLAKQYAEKLKNNEVISIVQIGSSLRKKDFNSYSDLDFLVIQKKKAKDFLQHGNIKNIETNIVRHGKSQFLNSLKEGNPIDLVALKFGKIMFDNGFFESQRKISYKPNKNTIDRWMHTASFNLSDASRAYSMPASEEYFKSLHHAAREFCRAIIVKEFGEVVEGNTAILDRLKHKHPGLYKSFKLIIYGRKSYEYTDLALINHKRIKNSGHGKYLLAAEETAIGAFRICRNVKMPRINNLLYKLSKRVEIDYFMGFYLVPESCHILINLALKKGKVIVFVYDMKGKKLKRLS